MSKDNPRITFYGNNKIVHYNFDNGLVLRAVFYTHKTVTSVYLNNHELRDTEIISLTADAFADVLYLTSRISSKRPRETDLHFAKRIADTI